MSENYFNLLKDYLKKSSTSEAYKTILDMDVLYSKVFLSSKEKNLDNAVSALNKAEDVFNFSVKGTSIEDHVNIIRLPIIAYLYFKLDKYKEAHVYLENSIEASLVLEQSNKSFLLEMYRIQQYHNNARIFFRKKDYDHWTYEMNATLIELLNNKRSLNDQEAQVFIGMVDQLINEAIKFSGIVKEEKYLEKILSNLHFENKLFETNDSLQKIKEWCTIKSHVFNSQLEVLNEPNNIENIISDSKIHNAYKKSLIISIAPYLKDDVFLKYLNVLRNKRLAC